MVKRYSPVIELEYGCCEDTYTATMQESEDGGYVKLTTYFEETYRLKQQKLRLKKEISRLLAKIATMKGGTP